MFFDYDIKLEVNHKNNLFFLKKVSFGLFIQELSLFMKTSFFISKKIVLFYHFHLIFLLTTLSLSPIHQQYRSWFHLIFLFITLSLSPIYQQYRSWFVMSWKQNNNIGPICVILIKQVALKGD